CGVATADAVIAEPLICVTAGRGPGEGMHVATQRPPLGMLTDSQSAAARPLPPRPHPPGAVPSLGAAPPSPGRPPPRWIRRVGGLGVALAFSPRHSETSHRFPFRHRSAAPRSTAHSRWPAVCGESYVPSYGSVPILLPAPGHFRPYRRRGRVRLLGGLTTHYP